MLYYYIIILTVFLSSTSARVKSPFQNHPGWCHRKLVKQSPPGEPVALVAYPGSGGVWLRYLLQQATGILTGSTSVNSFLKVIGFPGEGISNGSVLVVKTDKGPPQDCNKFTSAILLIRSPRDTILTEFMRNCKDALGSETSDKGRQHNKDWNDYVQHTLTQWETLNRLWLMGFLWPVHLVFYEHLVNDTRGSLIKILNFLNYKYSAADLNCALNHGDLFTRPEKLPKFDPFTNEMYNEINAASDRLFELRDRNKYHSDIMKIGNIQKCSNQ